MCVPTFLVMFQNFQFLPNTTAPLPSLLVPIFGKEIFFKHTKNYFLFQILYYYVRKILYICFMFSYLLILQASVLANRVFFTTQRLCRSRQKFVLLRQSLCRSRLKLFCYDRVSVAGE